MKKEIRAAAMGALLLLAFAGSACANQVKQQKGSTLPGAIKTAGPSVVQIQYFLMVGSGRGSPWIGTLGTGFIVTADGYVVTAKHVIDALEKIKPRDATGNLLPIQQKLLKVGLPSPNSTSLRGNFLIADCEVVDEDAIHDIALLKITPSISPPLVPAKLSPSRPEEGQPIAVSGYPLSSIVLITTSGAVASSWAYSESDLNSGDPDFSDWYLADMHVNPGNSGGPIYSVATGAVLGVCVSFETAQVKYGDGEKEPVKIQGRPVIYNSGLSVFVPIKYVIELLRKKNLRWAEVLSTNK